MKREARATLELLYAGRQWTLNAVVPPGEAQSLVQRFMTDLPKPAQLKLHKSLQRLADYGPHPSREKCRSLGECWFELKEGPYRLMFFYLTEPDRRGVVLTHGFAKHRGPPLEVERQRAARLREQLAAPGPRRLDAD